MTGEPMLELRDILLVLPLIDRLIWRNPLAVNLPVSSLLREAKSSLVTAMKRGLFTGCGLIGMKKQGPPLPVNLQQPQQVVFMLDLLSKPVEG